MPERLTLKDAALQIMNHSSMQEYRKTLWSLRTEVPDFANCVASLLVNPQKIIVYFGQNHIGIEYIGSLGNLPKEDEYRLDILFYDYTKSEYLLDEIIGFEFDTNHNIRTPICGFMEDIFVPSNSALDLMIDSGWNVAAQPMIFGINVGGLHPLENHYTRLVNGFFYSTDDHGLLVRHIQWLSSFPLEISDVDKDTEVFGFTLWSDPVGQAKKDAFYLYSFPEDFQQDKLMRLNRFVELFNQSSVSEIEITQFLAEDGNQFILKMAFFSKEIHAEKTCVWADRDKDDLRPDFFVKGPDNYADIVEFKLPHIQSKAIVGSPNRETFSAEIQRYIAQTRSYRDYFNDPRNKKFVEDKYGFKVANPKRWLVIGRRWMFSSDDWRNIIADYRDLGIRTYDDIVSGVLAQLYS